MATYAVAQEKMQHEILAPFIELRTGPAKGYPVVYTLKRGELFDVVHSKTSWFKVTSADKQGWINKKQMERTALDGRRVAVKYLDEEDFSENKWELGFSSGEVRSDGGNKLSLFSLYSGYGFTPNITAEVTTTQVLGKFSDSVTMQLNLTHEIAPDWLVSPLFSVGLGTIATDPKVTLGESKTIENDALNWGLGAKYYLANRFFLRVDYNKYLLLTENNDIGKVESWKVGVGAFF